MTYSGTADNGDDFTGVIQVTIPAGASSVDLDLTVIDDLLAEGDEIVDITISNPVGGGFEDIGINPDANTADMTIINDDDIQINVAPTTAFEGEDLVHVVTLSNPSMTDETFSFNLAEGTATEGVDYSNTVSFSDGVTLDPVTGDITVPAGVTSFTVTYPTIDDSYADDGETTTLTIGGSSATGTINDETPPDLVEVSIVDNYPEGDAGTVSEGETAVFPIELRDEDGNYQCDLVSIGGRVQGSREGEVSAARVVLVVELGYRGAASARKNPGRSRSVSLSLEGCAGGPRES